MEVSRNEVRFVRFNAFDNSKAFREHPFAQVGTFCWAIPEWAFDAFCETYLDCAPVEVVPGSSSKVFHCSYEAADRFVTVSPEVWEPEEDTPEAFGLVLLEGFETVGIGEGFFGEIAFLNESEYIISGEVSFQEVVVDPSKADKALEVFTTICREERQGKDEYGSYYPVFYKGR